MGQQQLLLLVLGIVIVGLAVVVGINAFGENQKRANADALVNDALRIASDVQAWALKPEQFGGAGGWTRVDIGTDPDAFFQDELGYSLTDGEYINVNGSFEIAGDSDRVLITASNDDQSNAVYISVCGVTQQEILTQIDYQGVSGSQEPRACTGDGTGDGTDDGTGG